MGIYTHYSLVIVIYCYGVMLSCNAPYFLICHFSAGSFNDGLDEL